MKSQTKMDIFEGECSEYDACKIISQEEKIKSFLDESLSDKKNIVVLVRTKIHKWNIADNKDYFEDSYQINEAIRQVLIEIKEFEKELSYDSDETLKIIISNTEKIANTFSEYIIKDITILHDKLFNIHNMIIGYFNEFNDVEKDGLMHYLRNSMMITSSIKKIYSKTLNGMFMESKILNLGILLYFQLHELPLLLKKIENDYDKKHDLLLYLNKHHKNSPDIGERGLQRLLEFIIDNTH